MISKLIMRNNQENQTLYNYDIRCLSTDTKPTEDIPNGSVLIEIDTGKGYLFDAENTEWHELPSGGSVVINPARGVSF